MNNFGQTLRKLRREYGLTQELLANTDYRLSSSTIAMLETGDRSESWAPLDREQLWYIVEKLGLRPSDIDQLLKSANASTLRSEKEELYIQEKFEGLKAIWIFARVIRDFENNWFRVVSGNVTSKEPVKYTYFTARPGNFTDLVRKMIRAGIEESVINSQLECYKLPEELFVSNFAIYNPGLPDMYCCGTTTEHGKGVEFYTSSEGFRLFELLEHWKGKIDRGDPIELDVAKCLFRENLDMNNNTSISPFTEPEHFAMQS